MDLGSEFPMNLIPGLKGDFNDLANRINFGVKKCCNNKYYPIPLQIRKKFPDGSWIDGEGRHHPGIGPKW